jgi:hypothetical protein
MSMNIIYLFLNNFWKWCIPRFSIRFYFFAKLASWLSQNYEYRFNPFCYDCRQLFFAPKSKIALVLIFATKKYLLVWLTKSKIKLRTRKLPVLLNIKIILHLYRKKNIKFQVIKHLWAQIVFSAASSIQIIKIVLLRIPVF